MKRLLFLLITLLSIFYLSTTNAGEKKYPWNLFRGLLSNDHCDSNNPRLCRNSEKCEALDWYWYDNQCNKDKHPNQIKTEQLIGQWCTDDPPGKAIYYYFEEKTITEQKPGFYTIQGGGNWLSECSYKDNPVDYTNGTVTAWYDPDNKKWTIKDRSEFHCILEHQLKQITNSRFEGCTSQSGYYCSITSCEPGTTLLSIPPP